MHIIADICVIPTTGKTSLREEVAQAVAILRETGLPVQVGPFGSVIEGEFDAVMAAVKRIHEALHAGGAVRITTTIKIGSRVDKPQSAAEKVAAVEEVLRAPRASEAR